MLFCAQITVALPHDMEPERRTKLLADEKEYAQGIQRGGEWPHLWRVVGQTANISIFDVADHERLHAILSGLPLFPFMTIDLIPLARHPSAVG